jgi:glycosyltransferase involved in cell wall biosynthesis
MLEKKIAIIGTVGIPANYGGFETLAENLVKFHYSASLNSLLTVYCSSNNYLIKKTTYLSAQLKYVPLNANGSQSILYDIVSLISAVLHRNKVILLLGVSGAIALPFIRLFSLTRIIVNIDGIEWQREKWKGFAKYFLRLSEKIAVRFAHDVIADNVSIESYILQTYGVTSHLIAYGGDHVISVNASSIISFGLPATYAFSVCRIEPENNIHIILEAFSKLNEYPLVVVGNWLNSNYGRKLLLKYKGVNNLFLLESIYDLGKLKTLRSDCSIYIHGHSAGGTNPALVEAMHFGKPVLAFDCDFNRNSTENKALYFKSSKTLVKVMENLQEAEAEMIGCSMLEIAQRRYTWSGVAKKYFALLNQ